MIAMLAAGAIVLALLGFFLLRKGSDTNSVAKNSAKPAAKSTALNTKEAPPAKKRSAPLPEVLTDAVANTEDAPAVEPVPEALQGFTLRAKDSLSEEEQAAVDEICSKVAEPHPVQRQLAAELDTPEALIDAVSSDPGLTAGILKTVNSAAFALTSPINSVQHAITYLGMGMVKSIVAQAAMNASAAEGTAEQQAALAKIWKAAGAASAVAQLIGQELGVERPSVLATRALFNNLGDIAWVSARESASAWYTSEVTLIERIRSQQAEGGVNSAVVGAQLAARWALPEELCAAIGFGLEPLVAASTGDLSAEDPQSQLLVYLSSRIGDRVAYGGLTTVDELSLGPDRGADIFYTLTLLDEVGLARVPAVLNEVAFKRKLNRLFATFNA
ncbi:MAG: hypothetical protein Cons2KO_22080 [Congregibacter sp.]